MLTDPPAILDSAHHDASEMAQGIAAGRDIHAAREIARLRGFVPVEVALLALVVLFAGAMARYGGF